jgi:diamine N-acetyltransferase
MKPSNTIGDLPGRGFPAVGLIDLFDFDQNNRAGGYRNTGLDNRKQNIGSEALGLLIQYSFNNLNLHQLYANIAPKMKQVKLFLLNLASNVSV